MVYFYSLLGPFNCFQHNSQIYISIIRGRIDFDSLLVIIYCFLRLVRLLVCQCEIVVSLEIICFQLDGFCEAVNRFLYFILFFMSQAQIKVCLKITLVYKDSLLKLSDCLIYISLTKINTPQSIINFRKVRIDFNCFLITLNCLCYFLFFLTDVS